MPRLPFKAGLAANTLAAGSILEDLDFAPRPTLAQVLTEEPERAIFYVTYRDRQWRIRFNGSHSRKVFPTQEEAVALAVLAGRVFKAMGFPAAVRVQGIDSRFRTEWTYLNDPYPPIG